MNINYQSSIKKVMYRCIFSGCLGLLILLASCEYKPTDTIFKEVAKPVTPPASIDLPFDKDTVYISGNTNAGFGFSCPDYKIYKIAFSLDNREIYSTSGNSSITGEVNFNYNFIGDGTYQLKMESVVQSKSGSVGDKIGAEAFSFTKNWVLIYKRFPDKPQITFCGPDNGRLKITWEKCKFYNFQSYKIKKGVYDDFLKYYYFQDIATISDASKTFFIDSSMIGGTVKYTVSSVIDDVESASDPYTYKSRDIKFNIQTDHSLNCLFTWNKTEFYNNFGNVEILYENLSDTSYSVNMSTLLNKNNVSDTSFTMKDGLLFNRRYYLYIEPKVKRYIFSSDGGIRIIKDHYSEGETFYPSDQICFTAVDPYDVYGKTSTTIFKYSTSNGDYISKPLKSSKFGIAASLNGNYLMAGEYNVNPSTLDAQPMDIQSQMKFLDFFIRLSISDNGIFVGETRDYNEKAAYDIVNKKSLQVIKSVYQIYSPKVSPNGQYVVMTGDYYPRIEIWKFNSTSSNYEEQFYQHGDYKDKHFCYLQTTAESKFYIANGNSIELWSCEQAKVTQSYNTDATDVIQIDPVTKNIVAYKPGHLLIYDANNFKLLWDMGIDPTYLVDWNAYHPRQFVVVNSVVYTNGKKLDLNKYAKVN